MKNARWFGVLLSCVLVAATSLYSQASSFRSAKSGNWQDTLTWQKSTDGGDTWKSSSTVPSGSEQILIQAAHTVTLNISLSLTNIQIDGQLTVPFTVVLTAAGGYFPSEPGKSSARLSLPKALYGGVTLYGTIEVQGGFEISGPSFNTSWGSTVIFSGSQSQTVPGGTYASLTINNSAGASLTGGISVQASLTIQKGNLHTGSNSAELGSSATLSESDPYELWGIVYSARTCTTGTRESFGGIGAEIKTSGGPAYNSFTVTRYTGDAPSIQNVNTITRSFDISPSTNSGLNASLVFHYATSELYGASPSSLQLYKSNGSTWTNVGGSVDAGARILSLSGIDSFSSWTAGVPIPVPAIVNISPSVGTRGSTMNVTITGTNFEMAGTGVSFSGSGISVNSITHTSPTILTVNITINASAAVGFRDVSVSNAFGTGSYSNCFQVTNPPPTLSSLSPVTGAPGQSMPDTLRGGGFISDVTSVSFGAGITVNSVSVTSSQQLVAQLSIGAGAALGARTVTVTNAAPGGGTASIASGFNVVPVPTLTGVFGDGVRGRSATVLLTGSNFFAGVTVVGIGSGISIDSVTVLSISQIRVRITIPYTAASGPRDVWVSNSGGNGPVTLSGAFTVLNPTPAVTAVSPVVGGRGKTLTLTLSGSDFISGVTTVSLGSGLNLGPVTVLSPTQLAVDVTIPRNTPLGSRDVTVTNAAPGGGPSTLPGSFSVQNSAPVLLSVAPASTVLGQTLGVVLTGSCFMTGVSNVDFGAGVIANSISVDTAGTTISATITVSQSALAGVRAVTVTNPAPGGGASPLANAFTIMNPVPTLTTITPAGAGKGQTANVNLTGTNFVAGVTTVTFGVGITVNSVSVGSPTAMTVNITVSPTAVVGARSVTATNPSPGGGNATLLFVFNVENPPPTLSSVTPGSGTRGSMLSLSFAGTNFFTPGTTVTMGSGISVNSLTAVSSTQMRIDIVISFDAALGTRDISVTNPLPGGGTITLPNGFTVVAGAATYIESALGSVPDQYVLNEAFPNPFNPSTKVRYGLPENSEVTLDIHNMLGNTVAELVRGERSKGMYELTWHAANLPSGVYLIRLHAVSLESSRQFISSRKVMLMK